MRIDTTFILSRNLGRPIGEMETPAGLRLAHLRQTTDEGFSQLDALCSSSGFPGGWAATMLRAEGEAFVAFADPSSADPSSAHSRPDASTGATPAPFATPSPAVAAGWMTRAPFFVDELGYTFTPVPEGVYLFGDFVEPAWRGRKLQRWMLHRRLEASAQAGRQWVFSMTDKENAPSLRNQFAEGFEHSATLRSMRLGRLRIERLAATNADVPHGWVFAPGRVLPGSIRVRRDRG